MADESCDLVIEYSLDGGGTWCHGRTVPAWVGQDAATLRLQRQAVREQARADHGDVERVTTRVLAEDDPRAVFNQPPAAGPGGPDLLAGVPFMPVEVAAARGGPEVMMALFLAMELDLAEEMTAQGIVPVSVMHGDPGSDEELTAIGKLGQLATACGCKTRRGGADYMTFLFRGPDAQAAAMRFTTRADGLARPGWIITPTFSPQYPTGRA